MGGLTAAHKLAQEGHEVHIYEKNPDVGGQARSRFTSDGEHSEYCFHVIANTFTSLLTLLREIPIQNGAGRVIDRLKRIDQHAVGMHGNCFIVEELNPMTTSSSKIIKTASKLKLKLKMRDVLKMVTFQLFVRTSTPERFEKYDGVYWKDFLKSISPGLKKYVIDHLGAIQLGEDPMQLNVHTILNFGRPTKKLIDAKILNYYRFNGPMHQQFFEPWIEYLKDMGVFLHLNTKIKDIRCEGGKIKEVVVEDSQSEQHIQYDHYVNGLDVKGFAEVLTGADEVKEKMLHLSRLSYQIQAQLTVTLKEKVLFGKPTMIYLPDTPWQIVICPEGPLWDVPLSKNQPPASEVLAMAIGVWNVKGILYGKIPLECSKEELMLEVWAQTKQCPGILNHFKTSNGHTLNNIEFSSYNIWYSFNNETGMYDTSEPKFSNNVGTFNLRPSTLQKEISNMVHATAYVRTDVVADSMDSAVEAGTRAANYINCGRAEPDVARFIHPGWFWGTCQYFDHLLFKVGLPNVFELLLNWI